MPERRKRKFAVYFESRFRPFVEITRKYRTPRIKMTRSVRFALLLLRVYLIIMVGILVFKFFTSA